MASFFNADLNVIEDMESCKHPSEFKRNPISNRLVLKKVVCNLLVRDYSYRFFVFRWEMERFSVNERKGEKCTMLF
jgi:hypothetical protein